MALLDIDNFDHVNRAYGEAVGDKMIKLTAEALRSYFPEPKDYALLVLEAKSSQYLKQTAPTAAHLDQCRIGVAENYCDAKTSASL
ncbi:diguanylate cyclase [Vibrio chagasii]|nr:diguanylate cyclase [Vibrio chagasii]